MSNMSFQIASDLHIDQIKKESIALLKKESNLLILAGDICPIVKWNQHLKFFKWISETYQYVIYVPGNHEFYNEFSFSVAYLEKIARFFLKSFKNIFFLQNQSILFDQILFTGCTYWCNPYSPPPSSFKIPCTMEEIRTMHMDSRNYIKKMTAIGYKKHVVITHYPPLKLNDDYEDQMDLSNYTNHTVYTIQESPSFSFDYKEYYENEELEMDTPPQLWIFGHTHRNMDRIKKNTRYFSNQSKDIHYKNNITISISS